MPEYKAAGIAAAAAFAVSLLLCLAGGAAFPALILRPLVFAALFFGLVIGARVLAARYLPELLERPEPPPPPEIELPGSRIDITEDGPALPGLAMDDGAETLDDITRAAAALTAGMEPDAPDPAPPGPVPGPVPGPAPAAAAPPGGLDQTDVDTYTAGDDADKIPDVASLVGGFESAGTPGGGRPAAGGSKPPVSLVMKEKPQGIAGGDFHPDDLAKGIRTMLKRE